MKWIRILFKFLIAIISEVVIHLFAVPLGIGFYFFRLKQKNRITIVLCNHIGDIVYTVAVVEQLNERYQNTTILLEKRWSKLLNTFVITAEVKTISAFWHWIIFLTNKTEVGQRIMYYSDCVKIVNTGDYFTLGYEIPKRIEGCSLIDCVHRISLGLDKTYEIKCKRKKIISERELEEIADCYGILKGKTIILAPKAHSVQRVDFGFFELLAKYLQNLGYIVLTNVSSEKEEPINGTRRFSCALDKVIEIAEYCGHLIGVRSGLMDLVSLSECQIIALYHPEDKMNYFYDIRKNRKDKGEKLLQYQLTGNGMQDISAITYMLK